MKICSVKIGMDAKLTLDQMKAGLAKKGLKLTNQRIIDLALDYTSEHLEEFIDYIMSEGEEMRRMLANPKKWGISTSPEEIDQHLGYEHNN
ncbi:MAG: hypothetical protein QXJ68_08585 [Methanocellales archaeon]